MENDLEKGYFVCIQKDAKEKFDEMTDFEKEFACGLLANSLNEAKKRIIKEIEENA